MQVTPPTPTASNVTIDGTLTAKAFADIVIHGSTACIAPATLESVRRCHETSQQITRNHTVYGRSTGVGANKTTAATLDEKEQGISLLRSHCVDAGEPYTRKETRAMLTIRLNQLCNPGSGIDPDILTSLVSLINSDSLPMVRRFGSVGTADLTALAGTALAMAGERPLFDRNGNETSMEHLTLFTSQSALPFISSSAMTLGETLLSCMQVRRSLAAETVAYALIMMVERGNLSPLSVSGAQAVAVSTAKTEADKVNTLLHGCLWKPRNIQDTYALRAWLSMRANTTRALQRLEDQSFTIANTAQENPLFLSETLDVVHHGAFMQAALAHEIAGVTLAIAQEATLLLARVTGLNDPRNTDLPKFLAPEQAGTSGTMIVEYVAGSAEGEILAAANPICPHTAVLSNGLEEDATFATGEAEQLRRSADALETMVACELLVALRAARMEGLDAGLPDDCPLRQLFTLTSKMNASTEDRDLRNDLDALRDLLDDIANIVDQKSPATPQE